MGFARVLAESPELNGQKPTFAVLPFLSPPCRTLRHSRAAGNVFNLLRMLDYPSDRRYLNVMELLDLLEQRVGSLLDEVAALRVENRRLREEVAAGQHKDEEIRALRDEAAQEKQVREQALTRVDALLRRIQSHLEDGPETDPAAANASPDRR